MWVHLRCRDRVVNGDLFVGEVVAKMIIEYGAGGEKFERGVGMADGCIMVRACEP